MVKQILNKLKNSSIQTIFLVVLYAICAPSLSTHIHQIFYTISIFIKDMLIWFIPLIVGVFIANTIDSFGRKAPLFLLIIIMFEACSNFLSVCYSYGAGIIVSSELQPFEIVAIRDDFSVLWRMPFSKPLWWGADNGVVAGFLLGCTSAFFKVKPFKWLLSHMKWWIETILTTGFSRIIPIFVLGFVAQIYETGMLNHMMLNYGMLIVYLIPVLVIYVFMIFALGNGFKPLETIKDIRNLIPAAIISFTSCCRISTMPLTIRGTSKNLRNPEFAKSIIPATMNIQQIGDCIANSFLCFLIYKNFFGHNPDILTWSTFTFIFVAARFATAAVVGGAIFLMLPI